MYVRNRFDETRSGRRYLSNQMMQVDRQKRYFFLQFVQMGSMHGRMNELIINIITYDESIDDS